VIKKLEQAIKEMNINLYEVFTSVFHPLKESYILNSGSSIHITKDKYQFLKYKPALLEDRMKYRGDYMAIQGYKDLDI